MMSETAGIFNNSLFRNIPLLTYLNYETWKGTMEAYSITFRE